MKGKHLSTPIQLSNKKALFSYHLFDKYTAGVVLSGYEVKAIKQGKANLVGAYCFFKVGELWVKGLAISQGLAGVQADGLPVHKLLLRKVELNRLRRAKEEKGYTIIPLRLFTTSKSLLKIEVALAKGKKLYDKRATIKARDLERRR